MASGLSTTCACAFSPVQSGRGRPGPYGRSDVVAALAAVSPRNWDGFLTERIDAVAPRAPLAGLRASGWRLTYSDDPERLR